MMFLSTLSFLGVLFASNAVPSVGPAPHLALDACITIAPDAQATLGPNNDANTVQYYGTGYNDVARTCRRFVADFSVLPSAKPVSNLEMSFSLHGATADNVMPSSKTECEALRVSTIFYKKKSGAANFAKIGATEITGQWIAYQPDPSQLFESNGVCQQKYKSGAAPTGTPNADGTDVYRVAVRAISGGPRAVEASILFIMTPPS